LEPPQLDKCPYAKAYDGVQLQSIEGPLSGVCSRIAGVKTRLVEAGPVVAPRLAEDVGHKHIGSMKKVLTLRLDSLLAVMGTWLSRCDVMIDVPKLLCRPAAFLSF
jgi:hypothetical protein